MATVGEIIGFVRLKGGPQFVREFKGSMSRVKNEVNNVKSALQGAFGLLLLKGLNDEANTYINAQRKLAATSKLTGVELKFLRDTANQAKKEFNLTTQQTNEMTIAVTKLTNKAGDIDKTGSAIGRLLDLAAAQGLNAEEALIAINQAILGIDEGTDKLFQKNPSVIYKEYADQIGTTAGKLTDQQKAQALLNAVLTDGLKVQGEYQNFLETAPGKQSSFTASLKETKAEFGLMLQAFAPLVAEGTKFLRWINQADPAVRNIVAALALLTVQLRIIKIGLAALSVSLGPTGWFIAGISALSAGYLTLNKAMSQSHEESIKQKTTFDALTGSLINLNSKQILSNIEQGRKKELIRQLNEGYGDYLGNLNVEAATNKELRDAMKDANEELKRKIAILALQEDIAKQTRKSVDAEKAFQDAVKKRAELENSLAEFEDDEFVRQKFGTKVKEQFGVTARVIDESTRKFVEATKEQLRERIAAQDEEVKNFAEARDEQLKIHQQFLNKISDLNKVAEQENQGDANEGGNKNLQIIKNLKKAESDLLKDLQKIGRKLRKEERDAELDEIEQFYNGILRRANAANQQIQKEAQEINEALGLVILSQQARIQQLADITTASIRNIMVVFGEDLFNILSGQQGGFKQLFKAILLETLTFIQHEFILARIHAILQGVFSGGLSLLRDLPALLAVGGLIETAKAGVRAFAEGGLVTRPTLGLVGENGPEIIAPVDQFKDFANRLLESQQPAGSGDVNLNLNFTGPLHDRRVARKLAEEVMKPDLKRQFKKQGRLVNENVFKKK